MSEDLAITIMEERIRAGTDIVKKIAKENNLQITEAIFIKGVECGISLFIQKETARRVSNYKK